MEFVLACVFMPLFWLPSLCPPNKKWCRLEKPCLAHIEVDLTKSSEPSGHVLTATMPLLNACQYPHSFTDGGPSLEVSKSIFDRLTLLSPQLVDEEELSPIQLWNYIVDQQIAYRLDNNQLQILAQNLLQHIKCYGYVCNRLLT